MSFFLSFLFEMLAAPITCVCCSYDRSSTYNVYVGKKQLIEGMDRALVGMCVNERHLVTIPPQLAYGKEGYGKLIV